MYLNAAFSSLLNKLKNVTQIAWVPTVVNMVKALVLLASPP